MRLYKFSRFKDYYEGSKDLGVAKYVVKNWHEYQKWSQERNDSKLTMSGPQKTTCKTEG